MASDARKSGASNLLAKLVRGTEKSRFVLLETHDDVDARQLLRLFVRSDQLVKQTVLALDSHPSTLAIPDHVGVCDLFSELKFDTDGAKLLNRVRTELLSLEAKAVNHRLYIDTLDSLLIQCDFKHVHNLLNDLLNTYELIVAAVSKPLVDDTAGAHLGRLATTRVDVGFDAANNCYHALVAHKKRSKRIGFTMVESDEHFVVADNAVSYVKTSRSKAGSQAESGEQDLAELTFNLTLNESELKARELVTLPYLK